MEVTAPALNWDEAALGYNAYTLGIDGRDEFGVFLPYKYLESYGDYKPVVYSYLAIVPVKIFGLNEFGVRFPSALLGVLTVLLTYFLVKEIFYKKKDKNIEYIALFSALIMAISPWHVMLSRAAYEANVSTFFIVFGVYLFLKAVNKNMWLLVLSAASFAITFYTFNTARVFIPLLGIALVIGFWRKLLIHKKETFVAGIIGALMILPILTFLFSPQAKLRFAEVNIFTDSQIVLNSNEYVENDGGAYWSKLLHNRRVLYGIEFAKHYLDNFNPSFLFITGDGNPRFSTQDVGQMYLWSLPFLIFGTFLLFRKREGHFWIIPVWIILGMIPAATARETPHALRIETILPTLQILVAYGFINFIFSLKKYRNMFAGILLTILFISTLYFYHGLTSHYAREYSSEWQYPYKELISYLDKAGGSYSKIYVTTALGRPYIYFLVYDRVDPKLFRNTAEIEREALGFVHIKAFDKFEFDKEIENIDSGEKSLYIISPAKLPEDVKVLKEFRTLDGQVQLVAYEKNK